MKRKLRASACGFLGILSLFFLAVGFLSAETITIINPVDAHTGIFWRNGTIPEITWKADVPLAGNVKIELLNESSTQTVLTIATQAPNLGHFRWRIPVDLASDWRRIRITFLSSGASAVSDKFLIWPYVRATSPPPYPSVTKWKRGQTYAMFWKWNGPAPASVVISAYEWSNWDNHVIIGPFAPLAGTYSWKVPHDFKLGKWQIAWENPAYNRGEALFEVEILPALIFQPGVPLKK